MLEFLDRIVIGAVVVEVPFVKRDVHAGVARCRSVQHNAAAFVDHVGTAGVGRGGNVVCRHYRGADANASVIVGNRDGYHVDPVVGEDVGSGQRTDCRVDRIDRAVAPVDGRGVRVDQAHIGEGRCDRDRVAFVDRLVGSGGHDRGHVKDADFQRSDVDSAVIVADRHGNRVVAVVDVEVASGQRAECRVDHLVGRAVAPVDGCGVGIVLARIGEGRCKDRVAFVDRLVGSGDHDRGDIHDGDFQRSAMDSAVIVGNRHGNSVVAVVGVDVGSGQRTACRVDRVLGRAIAPVDGCGVRVD